MLKKTEPILERGYCLPYEVFENHPEEFPKIHNVCKSCPKYHRCEVAEYVPIDVLSDEYDDYVIDELIDGYHSKAKEAFMDEWYEYANFDERDD